MSGSCWAGRVRLVAFTLLVSPVACLTPPSPSNPGPAAAAFPSAAAADGAVGDLDAWAAAARMSPGVNIGNTLENTTQWETGWGNPRITEEYVQRLKALGFKTIRVPVAWDTYAVGGQIQAEKLARVGEVVDWITNAGLFAAINIHWDGGWIDSGAKEKFPNTYATFSKEAEAKYRSYWGQIAKFFADRKQQLLFESLNEETKFDNEGSAQKAYATLTRVNQIFIDTVRASGGNNAKRLLIVAGYTTDITKTCDPGYALPKDSIAQRLLISVHYYTPWQFAGMTQDESWGKMAPTWGEPADYQELNRLFDMMAAFCAKNDLPAFIGEYGVTEKKESPSRVRWLTAVTQAALARKMVPVLWETGHEISRNPPFDPSPDLQQVLQQLPQAAAAPAPAK